jgi:predicted RNA-binding Zn-ribbon protein involved in translation (DUF1610 family)
VPATAGNFPCKGCGGTLSFEPGTESLKCPFCGVENEIARGEESIDEHDLLSAIETLSSQAQGEADDKILVKCTACGAQAELPENVTSGTCPFCGTPQVAVRESRKLIKPGSVLPFAVEAGKGRELFRGWLAGRWFAPSDLMRAAAVDGVLQGWYIPYWTYDSRVETDYTGYRGDDYYVPVTRTVFVNGKAQTRTVMERRTRWSYASGRVRNAFDDVQVPASNSLPAKHIEAISEGSGWDVKNLVPYKDEYLAGLRAESYTVDLRQGFEVAKGKMMETVRVTVRRDIGGDHQRITSMNPRFSDLTYKHLLVPIWLAAYRYGGTSYRFLINARTGAVSGDRPYSAWKITGFVLAMLALAGVIALVVMLSKAR